MKDMMKTLAKMCAVTAAMFAAGVAVVPHGNDPLNIPQTFAVATLFVAAVCVNLYIATKGGAK